MINDASVVIGGGNWGIKEADVLGYKLINDEYYARDIDFANSTAAGTYTDSTGVVRKAPYNLLQQSNTFSTTWATALATVTIGQTGYDGTSNAWLLEKSNTDGRIGQSITPPTGAYTYSVYAKAGTKNWVLLRVDGASNRTAYFNLQTGVTGTATGCTSSISSVGDGWYRCSITYTDAITIVRIYVADANNDTSGTSGNILIQAAQLVEGAQALPYFPTTTRLNVPRIDYRNADGSLSTVGRLLIEPQRTNSIRNSSMVGAVAGTPGTLPTNWSISNLGTLTRTVIGTGTENGLPYIDYRIQGTASNTTIQFAPEPTTQIAATNGQTWASSYYLKSVAGTIPDQVLRISQLNSFGTNLATNTQSIVVDGTLKRYSYAFTMNQATTAFVFTCVQLTTTVGATYDFTIRIAAPQMELGAYETTWIPTTTATVTRNADVASRTGVSSWIGQTQGTLFCEVNIRANKDSVRALQVSDGTLNNRIQLAFNANNFTPAIVTGGVSQASFTVPFTAGNNKIAIAYANNDVVIYLNGTQVGVDTSATIPACSLLDIGQSIGGTNTLGDTIAQAIIFPTRLTNEQLQSLTTL